MPTSPHLANVHPFKRGRHRVAILWKNMMRKRRGRGEGAIYRRGDNGIWCSIVTVGCDQDGKRKRRYVYGQTKKEVQEKLLKLHDDASKGLLIDFKKVSVGEFYVDGSLRS